MNTKNLTKKAIITAMACILLLTGCGSSSSASPSSSSNTTETATSYASILKDGVYYVRSQADMSCTPVYFGKATFEPDTVPNSSNPEHVMWFKDDFDAIPTLYSGDSLIYYTEGELDEKMVFERFEDYGYTVGLCGLERLKSGRYKISTDVKDKCTYPDGDTDEIIKYTNGEIILDYVNTLAIRADVENKDNPDPYLSASGTLIMLAKDKYYPFYLYEGTIEHECTFQACVRAMGSMDLTTSYDYEFTHDGIIEIKIPEWFNTGYYVINGTGMFRYVKGSHWDEDTNFNIPNKDPNKKTNDGQVEVPVEDSTAAVTPTVDPIKETEKTENTFQVNTVGEVTVDVSFTSKTETDHSTVVGIIHTPSGGNISLIYDGNNGLTKTFNAEAGTYSITYFDLGDRTPNVTLR